MSPPESCNESAAALARSTDEELREPLLSSAEDVDGTGESPRDDTTNDDDLEIPVWDCAMR